MVRNLELIDLPTHQSIESQFFAMHVLWRRRGWVLLGLILGLAGAAFCYFVAPPEYETTAQLMFMNKGQQIVPGLNSQMFDAEETLAVHEATITTPIVIRKAVETAGLHRLPSLKNEKDPTKAVMSGLKVSTIRENGRSAWSRPAVIELAYRSTNAKDCLVVLESVIASHENYLNQNRENNSGTVRKLFDQWSSEIQLQLGKKQDAFRKLLEVSPTIVWRDDRPLSLGQEHLAQIESQRILNLIRLTEAEKRLHGIETARQAGVQPRVLDQLATVWGMPANDMAASQEQYDQLVSDEQSLLVKYGPKHPEIQAIRRRIELLRSELPPDSQARDGNSPTRLVFEHALKHEREVAKELVESFSSQIEKEQTSAKQNSDGMVEIAQLHRDITGLQVLYEDIARQIRGLDLVKDSATLETTVIAPPEPGKKVSPKPRLLGAIGTFLGLLIGSGLAFLVEMSDKSIRSPAEVRRRLAVSVVGLIPPVRHGGRRRLLSEPEEQTPDSSVWTFHEPESFPSESVRGLRTSLVLAKRCDGNSVIQITSPKSGDGKSTIAVNLATSLAQSSQRVLLVEADFRSPSMRTLLPVFNPEVGLAAVLGGEVMLEEAIQTTGVPGLSLLLSGRIPGNPAELLTGSELHEVLQQIRQQFDFVLIDSPPLLAVSDAWMIVPYVDSVLLVVGPGSQWPHVIRAKEILNSLHTHTYGVVLNGMDFKEERSIYGGGRSCDPEPQGLLEHRTDVAAVNSRAG